MNSEDELKIKLSRMLDLLKSYNEAHWYSYFKEAQNYLAAGKVKKCKKHILGAYGGMCSFSDALYFTGARKETAKEGFALRAELYSLCK